METNLTSNVQTGLIAVRQPVGRYQLDQYGFYFLKKPNWFHRKMMKLFFGFVWIDKDT